MKQQGRIQILLQDGFSEDIYYCNSGLKVRKPNIRENVSKIMLKILFLGILPPDKNAVHTSRYISNNFTGKESQSLANMLTSL